MTDEGRAEVDRGGRAWLRPLLVRVVIDTAALLGAILLLSLIRLPERTADGGFVFDAPLLDTTGAVPLDLLLLGVILALVSTFVRPVLAAVLGLAIVRTFGLTVLVVNAIALLLAMWLTIEISGMQVVVADPRWLWLVVIAVVLSLLLFAVETLLGFNRPRLDDAGSVQPLWRLADRLPASGRNRPLENLRLAEVQEIILQYGLDISLAGTPLAPLRGVSDRLLGRDPDEFGSLSAPAKVRVMLQRLGPTYVKVGQMISSRSDELPPVWREELDKLQSTVPPFSWEQAEAIIRTELGASPDTLYATFEREPLGAASLAQVHRATLLDGTEVAVKVQRPNTQAMVRADLANMEALARQAERRIETARTMNLASLIHEFGQGVLTELDYGIEAYQAQRLAEVITGLEGVHVPRVYSELSSSRVVTYEFVRGVKATNVAALDEAGVDRDLVARRFLRAIIKQIVVAGFFHGDPHPGNIVIDPETGTVIFLDLGLVGELDATRRFKLLVLLYSINERDTGGVANAILALCERTRAIDEDAFRRHISRLVYQHWTYGKEAFSPFMTALFGVLSSYGLRLDKALTLAMKALVQAEELVRTLSPELPLVATGFADARELLEAEITPETVLGVAKGEATATALELGSRLPRLRQAAFSWLDQFEQGRLVMGIDQDDLQRSLGSVGSLNRNVTIGVIVAGQLIAVAVVLAVLVASDTLSDDGITVAILAFLGFLAFSMWMVRRVSRNPD